MPMYIESVPHRDSPLAVLLRESCRENGKGRERSLSHGHVAAVVGAARGSGSAAWFGSAAHQRTTPRGSAQSPAAGGNKVRSSCAGADGDERSALRVVVAAGWYAAAKPSELASTVHQPFRARRRGNAVE